MVIPLAQPAAPEGAAISEVEMPYRQFFVCFNGKFLEIRADTGRRFGIEEMNASHARRSIAKWRAADPVSCRMPSACHLIGTNAASGHGCAVRPRSRASTSEPPAGAEHRPPREGQPQHDFALDGPINGK
jgi:hypothetical protein